MALDKERHLDEIAMWHLWEEAEEGVEEADDGSMTCPACGYQMKTAPTNE